MIVWCLVIAIAFLCLGCVIAPFMEEFRQYGHIRFKGSGRRDEKR
jgi:hypothetical protein